MIYTINFNGAFMDKYFNTAGPIIPEDHYYIPSSERIDWEDLLSLIHQKKYFLLHAPRQTGKTSVLLELMEELNKGGKYSCAYANIEAAQAIREDVEEGAHSTCNVIANSVELYLKESRLKHWLHEGEGTKTAYSSLITQLLSYWATISEKPTVLFLDEADALIGDTLVSLLRQIRAGYAQRPQAFPQSIVLCGLRDIKDYRIHVSNGDIITGGSAFNIKAESLRMGNFTKIEVEKLWKQHSEETGQIFEETIFEELWEDTKGQPWLVNALAYELVWKDKASRDRTLKITLGMYLQAKERLIKSRATHLDQLADKLKEPRIHRVIAPLLAGVEGQTDFNDEDLSYAEDLGLITRKPEVKISNRIYREIIPRELTAGTQDGIHQPQEWYLTKERKLNITKLLEAFQQFFRENSDSWIEKFDYKEAGPQLLIQAFLQRIINGGGRINREYALGRKRTDLYIEWPVDEEKGFFGEVQRVVLELKIQRGSVDSTLEKALKQTAEYADSVKAEEAHLIYFNRDSDTSWDNRIWRKQKNWGNRNIDVWGC